MPSIWGDEPENQPTGAAPQGPDLSEPEPSFTPLGGNAASSSESLDSDVDPVVKLPSRIRSSFGGGVRTAGDAYEVCRMLIAEQLERALAERPPPNTSIKGDSASRTAFLLLLTDGQQRDLFLATASDQRSWPRLKTLVGSPPYHFLMPQDAAILNAAGFARGRVNMTYEHSKVANSGQFGPGQLVDEHTREYRVAPRKLDPTDPLPGNEYFEHASKDILLQVKVKRHNLTKKRELFHSEFKKQLLFPQPGEVIVLQETNRMLTARGLKTPSRTYLRVKALWPRGQGSSTAAVLVGF